MCQDVEVASSSTRKTIFGCKKLLFVPYFSDHPFHSVERRECHMENQVNGKILALAAAFVLFATPALSQVDYTQPEIYNREKPPQHLWIAAINHGVSQNRDTAKCRKT